MDYQSLAKLILKSLKFLKPAPFHERGPVEKEKGLDYELYEIQKLALEHGLVVSDFSQFRIELTSIILSIIPDEMIVYDVTDVEILDMIRDLMGKYFIEANEILAAAIYSNDKSKLTTDDIRILNEAYASLENSGNPKYHTEPNEEMLRPITGIFENNRIEDLSKYYGEDEIMALNHLMHLSKLSHVKGCSVARVKSEVHSALRMIRLAMEKAKPSVIRSRELSSLVFEFASSSDLSNDVSSVVDSVITTNRSFSSIYSIKVKCKNCGTEVNIDANTTQRRSNDEAQEAASKCSKCHALL